MLQQGPSVNTTEAKPKPGQWFRVADPEEIRLSLCCGARTNGKFVRKRYIDGYCRSCGRRCSRWDSYKDRFKVWY
jgi:hypothetical protein